MFVESPENLLVHKEMNFSLFGMGPRYRRRAERMKPDDRVLFYVKGLRKWPATATITSGHPRYGHRLGSAAPSATSNRAVSVCSIDWEKSCNRW